MSSTTDLLLMTGLDENDAIKRLNEWCVANDDREQEFTQVDMYADSVGGYKAFASRVWAMGANHFPWWELAEALPTFGWRMPVGVVLLIRHEHHDGAVLVFRADGPTIQDRPVDGWAAW